LPECAGLDGGRYSPRALPEKAGPNFVPSSLEQLFQKVFTKIANANSISGSSGMPGSLLCTIQPFTSDSLEISVVKLGLGLKVIYVPK
jgi:hypothetical protein